MNRRQALTGLAAAAVVTAVGAPTRADAATSFFPTTISLPDGFQPEGIAIGLLPYAFFGSRATGSIYRASLVTGAGEIITESPGGPSLGMKVDLLGRLFVAGGPGGNGRVVNAFTGQVLATYPFTAAPTFVNDVILTPRAAYFTDSLNPFVYVVPLGLSGLPDPSAVVRLPITGDLVYQAGFNANGISRTPDGRALLIVASNTGGLFRVDPSTGASTRVDLGGATLANGDGLLLVGRTLYAVQNQLNRVAVVRLDDAGTAGTVTRFITDSDFDIPTTAAIYGPRLYLPNARFSTPPTPTTEYAAIAVPA